MRLHIIMSNVINWSFRPREAAPIIMYIYFIVKNSLNTYSRCFVYLHTWIIVKNSLNTYSCYFVYLHTWMYAHILWMVWFKYALILSKSWRMYAYFILRSSYTYILFSKNSMNTYSRCFVYHHTLMYAHILRSCGLSMHLYYLDLGVCMHTPFQKVCINTLF